MSYLSRPLLLTLFLLSWGGMAAAAEPGAGSLPKEVLVLRNEHAVVGVLPAAAGRVVLFQRPDGRNILKEDRALWDAGKNPLPRPEDWDPKTAAHGQHYWVSPQSDFWNQQTVFPKRVGQNWPPDPWGEVAPYTVTAQDADGITLEGPVSPVTGLQLTKRYTLSADGSLTQAVTATNRRDAPVHWGLWSVTRLDPDGAAYAPVREGTEPRLALNTDKPDHAGSPMRLENGVFTFLHEEPLPTEVTQRGGKAFITPPKGLVTLAFLRGNDLFTKTFTPAEPEHVAKGHSPVEIYLDQRPDQPGTLELEFHGEYRTLQPGDQLHMQETWQLKKVPAQPTRAGWDAIVRAQLGLPDPER